MQFILGNLRKAKSIAAVRVTYVALWILALSIPTLPQPTTKALPLDVLPDVKILNSYTAPAVSNNGDWIAYHVLSRAKVPFFDRKDKQYAKIAASGAGLGCDIWVVNTSTGRTTNVTGGRGSNWGPSWSPDSRHLAYYSNIGGKPQLWFWDVASQRSRVVMEATVQDYFGLDAPSWSSDGKTILLKLLPRGLTFEEFFEAESAPSKPDTLLPKPVRGSTVVVFSTDKTPPRSAAKIEPSPYQHRVRGDLALIDVSSGREVQRVRGFNAVWFRLSPDGTNIALVHLKGQADGNSFRSLYDLILWPLNGEPSRVLASNIESRHTYIRSVSWSPDGRSLSYSDDRPEAAGEYFVVDIADGKPLIISGGKHPSLYHFSNQPLWDRTGENVYVTQGSSVWRISIKNKVAEEVVKIAGKNILRILPDGRGRQYASPDGGRSAIVITRDDQTKQGGFYKVDLADSKYSRIVESDHRLRHPSVAGFEGSKSPLHIVFTAESADHPADVWLANVDSQTSRRLTNVAPELDPFVMGKSRVIEWKTAEGVKLRGALLLPSNYVEGKSYPLIVNVYGGDLRSNEVNDFGFGSLGNRDQNLQLLATRGYAILSPDAPLGPESPISDLAKTVLPGVDKVIELGIADPARLGVMGHSYGGYSTMALITQTTRFKAAVSYAGFGDLTMKYGVMNDDGTATGPGWAETGQGRMKGPPWQFRDRYIENSPVFYLERVQTPLLLIAGANDKGVPPYLSEEVFVMLRRLGKKAAYAKYISEDHIIFNRDNQIDFFTKLTAWFDTHLKQ
jgi:dipeptidyl aminopeptidase/acylaminoacyl peptidase